MLQHLRRSGLSGITSTLDEFAALEVSPRALAATILLSTSLGLAALALGTWMVVIAAAVTLPWAPILFIKLRSDWKTYSWLAFFELVVILQIAHFAEHVSQMIELHFLSWAPILARGIISQLDVEPVHFWWNLIILFFATLLLLLRYRRNRWLWASWWFSIIHQIEHTYVYFWWFLPKGISNHPGILGSGGIVDEAGISIPYLTTMGRADLHFWYNFFEIGLFVVAFVWQASRIYRPRSRVQISWRLNRRNAFALLAASQIAIVTLIGLVHYSPATLSVPQNYATIQAAIDAAPEWAIIRVAPGVYREALQIDKPLDLVGSGAGATVIQIDDDNTSAITVEKTHDVIIKNLTVQGGLYGILIDFSRSVQITSSAALNSSRAGIRALSSSIDVEYSEIAHVRSPYGMGIELANTVNSGDSMLVRNTIHDIPLAGIDMHNSDAMIERNSAEHNGVCGITIAEMSMAMVNSNFISGNGECGIHVVDQSMAEMENNQVLDTKPGPSGAADGIKAEYKAEIMLRSNTIDAPPGHDIVLQSDATIEPWQ
jgi:Right handed beta helix region